MPKSATTTELEPFEPLEITTTKAKQLANWERKFVDWLCKVPSGRSLSLEEQCSAAQAFYNREREKDPLLPEFRVDEKVLTALKRRKAYKNYLKVAKKGGVRAAKRILKAQLPAGVEAHFQGLEMAKAAGDYDGMAKFTTPLLRQVQDKANQANIQAVQINISSKQAEMLEARTSKRVTVEEMDVEVVEE